MFCYWNMLCQVWSDLGDVCLQRALFALPSLLLSSLYRHISQGGELGFLLPERFDWHFDRIQMNLMFGLPGLFIVRYLFAQFLVPMFKSNSEYTPSPFLIEHSFLCVSMGSVFMELIVCLHIKHVTISSKMIIIVRTEQNKLLGNYNIKGESGKLSVFLNSDHRSRTEWDIRTVEWTSLERTRTKAHFCSRWFSCYKKVVKNFLRFSKLVNKICVG